MIAKQTKLALREEAMNKGEPACLKQTDPQKINFSKRCCNNVSYE